MAAENIRLIGSVRDQDGRTLQVHVDSGHLRIDFAGQRGFFHGPAAMLLAAYTADGYEKSAFERRGDPCPDCDPVPVAGPDELYECCPCCARGGGHDGGITGHRIACPNGCNDQAAAPSEATS